MFNPGVLNAQQNMMGKIVHAKVATTISMLYALTWVKLANLVWCTKPACIECLFCQDLCLCMTRMTHQWRHLLDSLFTHWQRRLSLKLIGFWMLHISTHVFTKLLAVHIFVCLAHRNTSEVSNEHYPQSIAPKKWKQAIFQWTNFKSNSKHVAFTLRFILTFTKLVELNDTPSTIATNKSSCWLQMRDTTAA